MEFTTQQTIFNDRTHQFTITAKFHEDYKAKIVFYNGRFASVIVRPKYLLKFFTLESLDEFEKFIRYVNDLASLHPSPSWPQEVAAVWAEYVTWQRSLKHV